MNDTWLVVALVVERAMAVSLIAHAVLHKRDVGSAIGWSGLLWLTPLVGSLLYLMLGINRIERRAARLRHIDDRPDMPPCDSGAIGVREGHAGLAPIAQLVDHVTGIQLTAGNRVTPLADGNVAYPCMIEAIANAEHSIGLATYIFDHDRAGEQFIDALVAANDRGVEVRVLIDGVGERYSSPPVTRVLRRRGVTSATFLKSSLPWRNPYLNLRNHRKIMVVDGKLAFTGGMNIREGCLLHLDPPHPVRDFHFLLEGPVVRQVVETFALDWDFTMNEALTGEAWYPPLERISTTLARGIADGPDEDLGAIYQVLLGALAQATERVRICTPYFLPNPTLIEALNTTAMRGVEVEIVVPARPNLRFVHWASMAQMGLLLPSGCRVIETPSPFDHTKLMLVDDAWVLLGSCNWDARSLRLNFEFNVECYDRDLAAELHRAIDEKVRDGEPLTIEAVDARGLPVRLRDGVARLFSPYL